jgi:anti-sigma factor RsiW
MMAMSNKTRKQGPGEIEMLLPWHATGRLSAHDSRRVNSALARDPELARQYAAIRDEHAGTMDFNEMLGAPSARVAQMLFAAIDADCWRLASC